SDYETEVQPTEPSTPDEAFSIESLIQRVEEFQRRDHLETLVQLTTENSDLQQRILYYQEEWCSTLDLLQHIHEALLQLQNALGRCFQEQMEAERCWLASWRTRGNAPGESGYSPTRWI
ncbi:uncharacterized protein A1O5_12672, partial [Cladophialophora psammophila CBS 110553]